MIEAYLVEVTTPNGEQRRELYHTKEGADQTVAMYARSKENWGARVLPLVRQSPDAARWRAFIRSTGHEVDLSTGPWQGKSKDMHIKINCTGCERYFESGAPDYEGTLNAVMDDEIKLQSSTPSAPALTTEVKP